MDFGHLALSSFVAAFATLPIGFIWYHEKVFGRPWMKAEGLTLEELSKGNMAKIFGLTLILAFVANVIIVATVVIHQFGALSMVGGAAAKGIKPSYDAFINDYGTAFRTFKHGALHGAFLGLFFIFPITAINGLFARKTWTATLINAGYWIVTLAIMGGIVCGWTTDGFHFA